MLKAKLVVGNNGTSEAWQLNTTLRLLTKATGISERSIRTCLTRLQRTGEIEYLPGVSHKQSIITICNYDSYQMNQNDIETETKRKHDTTKEDKKLRTKNKENINILL